MRRSWAPAPRPGLAAGLAGRPPPEEGAPGRPGRGAGGGRRRQPPARAGRRPARPRREAPPRRARAPQPVIGPAGRKRGPFARLFRGIGALLLLILIAAAVAGV